MAGEHEYLADLLRDLAVPQPDARVAHLLRHRFRPSQFADALVEDQPGLIKRAVVCGPFDSRIVACEGPAGWGLASLSGRALSGFKWPVLARSELILDRPQAPVSRARVSERLHFRLTRPSVLLISLYHPENFPLPRFPLGISDLARAIRTQMIGSVRLLDMQLGVTLPEILADIDRATPDIVGVSATFGQDDVLRQLMAGLSTLACDTRIVFGGSLSALNRDLLSEAFPSATICAGPGERLMQSVVARWHDRSELRPVSEGNASAPPLLDDTPRRTPLNRDYLDAIPELDLLNATLDHHGVMQLESSRGCTHACSFCPRSHKGRWSGYDASRFGPLLTELSDAYRTRPHLSRTVFLVDEEFVGSDKHGDAVARSSSFASMLHDAGFKWETSTRVDQVTRPDRGPEWHTARVRFWTHLRDSGLSRCLFGVESGVDSILKRFNKHTTGEQNAAALRILTSLRVPIRCTYITFDPLMDMAELLATYHFLGRRDLILRPSLETDPATLLHQLADDAYIDSYGSDTPFYSAVSYMLVSMEALLGSPYLAYVESAGLARDVHPSMGKRDAEYLDPRIGSMSAASQRWVDRNFSFDYLLKSLMKISIGDEQAAYRAMRHTLKEASYKLLGRMLAIANNEPALLSAGDHFDVSDLDGDAGMVSDWCELRERSFDDLRLAIGAAMANSTGHLEEARGSMLRAEHDAWAQRERWDLINA